ncbi:MAG: hypothetical protein HQL70_02895 [Magnetococcales bacterium]|nr:hypothetical protein [Magnetococcales bacterium]
MVEAVPNSMHCPVDLPSGDLETMIKLVKALYKLHQMPAYLERLLPQLPETARFDPGNESVMMGYDFHLTPEGPRLIEVNTNAGGLMLAWQSNIQPQSAANLLNTFANEMELFSGGKQKWPKRIVIMDSEPEKQYLYPEMEQFALLFKNQGITTDIVDPKELQASAEGVFFNGEQVDLIYNRNCDFYLESETMAGIKAAYLSAAVCLTPNPRSYGLLADKRRMLLWSSEQTLKDMGVDPATKNTILTNTPVSRLLAEFDPEQLWVERKSWAFKPVDSFGSRGAVLGKGLSRTRFAALEPATTLVQQLIPPSTTICPWSDKPMKTDLRLFVYQQKVLGVTARIYRGQVTSFKEPGSGYAPIKIV